MAAIIDFIRKLIRDVETSEALRDVSDGEIGDVIRQSLTTVEKAKIVPKYSHARVLFQSEYGHRNWVDGVTEVDLAAPVLFATVVFLRGTDGTDTEVDSQIYQVDPVAGLVYFDEERAEDDALYATYNFCNPYAVAADVLRSLANEYARLAVEAQSATFKVRYDRVTEVLLLAAEQTEARGGFTVGSVIREDRPNG